MRSTEEHRREHLESLGLLEEWDERAAIMEYCGKMSRPTAEYRAWQRLVSRQTKTDKEPTR